MSRAAALASVPAARRRGATPALLAATLLALLGSMPARAQGAAATGEPQTQRPQASGKFEGKVWTIETVGAYAYPAAEVGFDDEPGYKLAVSNGGFDAAWVDRFLDREHWIESRFKNDERLVVYFHFARNGAYKGLDYYFASGDGCGFCFDGSVRSTMRITGGRLAGRITLAPKPDEIAFDIEVDVPVAPAEPGKRLKGDGGDVAKVYAAYHQALLEGATQEDPRRVADFLTAGNRERYLTDVPGAFAAWYADHPAVRYEIVSAWAQGPGGDQALLVVDGAVSFSNVRVEVLLVKEDGAFRIQDEVLKATAGGGEGEGGG